MDTVRSSHPLMGKITHLDSWVAWYRAWRANPSVEIRHGLLHVGLDVPLNREQWRQDRNGGYHRRRVEHREERILFYLRVADGWTSGRNFVPEGKDWHPSERGPATFSNLTPPEQRQRLAAKAFAMLFSGPFAPFDEERARKDYDYRHTGSYWEHLEAREVLALLRFFRVCRREYGNWGLNNLPSRAGDGGWRDEISEVRAHLLGKVERFLVDFICFLWEKFKPQERSAYVRDSKNLTAEEQEKLTAAKAYTDREKKFAESLGRHHYLLAQMLVQLGHVRRLNRLPMDERTVQLLRRFALRTRTSMRIHDGNGRLVHFPRRVLSLEEVIAFSKEGARKHAAQFVLLYDATANAERKVEQAEAPERAAAQAEQARQETAYRESEAAKLEAQARALRTGKPN